MENGRKLLIFSLIFSLFLLDAKVFAAGNDAVIQPGMTGIGVESVQALLKDYGYYENEIDGVYGRDTLLAVLDFQADNGLEADGIIGAATLEALRDFKAMGVAVSRGGSSMRRGMQIAAYARQFLGAPYVWAGKSPGGFDCSGFIYYIYRQFSIDMPRMADEQFASGKPVAFRELATGDLVFFSTYEPGPSHVGIYMGGGMFLHASSGAGQVTLTPLSKAYYRERYLGARRVVW